MEKIRYIFLIALLLIRNPINAQQNLVPNYSFELLNSCPINAGQLSKLQLWHSASLGSPECFNACYDSTHSNAGVGTPQNFFGNESPYSGNGYVGIVVGKLADFREYIEVELLDSLLAGNRYIFKMFVSLSDSSFYSCNSIGAYLSTSDIFYNSITNILVSPQINNSNSNPLDSKSGWVLVEDTFISAGGEKYLTIGNFLNDSSSTFSYVGDGGASSGLQTSYYYIDDVSLVRDTSTGISELTSKGSLVKIWPNPFKETLYVNAETDQFPIQIRIYDWIGNLVVVLSLCEQNGSYNLGNLPGGIYFINELGASGESVWEKILKVE